MEQRREDPAPTLDDLTAALEHLRHDAGLPSYGEITRRVIELRATRGDRDRDVAPGRTTIYDAFAPRRRRLDPQLIADIVEVLGCDRDEAERWRRMCVAAHPSSSRWA